MAEFFDKFQRIQQSEGPGEMEFITECTINRRHYQNPSGIPELRVDTQRDRVVYELDIKGFSPQDVTCWIDRRNIVVLARRRNNRDEAEISASGSATTEVSEDVTFQREIPLKDDLDPNTLHWEIKEEAIAITLQWLSPLSDREWYEKVREKEREREREKEKIEAQRRERSIERQRERERDRERERREQERVREREVEEQRQKERERFWEKQNTQGTSRERERGSEREKETTSRFKYWQE